jgi:hypothetical protein
MTGYILLTHFNVKGNALLAEAVNIFWSSSLFTDWFLHKCSMRGPSHSRFDYEILYCSC